MMRKQHSKIKRCFLMIVLTILVAFLVPVSDVTGEVERTEVSADQIIRVLLTRLNTNERIDVTLVAPYTLLSASGAEMYFQPDSQLSFLLKNEKIYLYYQGMAVSVGNAVKLLRVDENATVGNGFYVTNFPALYMGDLLLDQSEGKLRPVLKMHVEDYLLGVLPYEMGESFPLEALKAQAVAARTYALRKQNPKQAYDVVDNTNDQAFRGYLPGNKKSEQAVGETQGICGFYQDELAQCFYSASNGGQMELVETIWPSKGDFDYYTFGEDPYDLENPLSMVKSYELLRTLPEISDEFKVYLVRLLEKELEQNGYDPVPESIRLDQIHSLTLAKPVFKDSKWYTTLIMEASISGRTKRDGFVPIEDQDPEEVNLFSIPAVTNVPKLNENLSSITASEPTVTPLPVYGAFTPLDKRFTIEIPIFPHAESLFGLNILGHYDNEIWSIRETEKSFILEARRYGHGVGMSQRGAQWMAGSYGKNFEEILSFYYPGMQLKQYTEKEYPFYHSDEMLISTAGPAPSPTPRPTLMPVTMRTEEGQWYASVTEISDDSSLNLRKEPNLNADILMRLYKHQRLLVLEEVGEGWVKVCTDSAEGYVKASYLTAEN